MRRVQHGSQQVEGGAHFEGLAHGGDDAHGGVEARGEHEGHADLVHAAPDALEGAARGGRRTRVTDACLRMMQPRNEC